MDNVKMEAKFRTDDMNENCPDCGNYYFNYKREPGLPPLYHCNICNHDYVFEDGKLIRFGDWEEKRPRIDITPEEKANYEIVNHPSHYCRDNSTVQDIECIDAIEASMSAEEFKGYLKGNIMKYIWRYDLKGDPITNLKKAAWYLDRLIDTVEVEEITKKED